MRSPFVKYDKDKFICPYCHEGHIKFISIDRTEIEYDYSGQLIPQDSYDIIEEEKIICGNCGMDLTNRTYFDVKNMKRCFKSDERKIYKLENPFSGTEEYYDI